MFDLSACVQCLLTIPSPQRSSHARFKRLSGLSTNFPPTSRRKQWGTAKALSPQSRTSACFLVASSVRSIYISHGSLESHFTLDTIYRADPDVIVGHDFLGVSLDVLLHRMKELKADHWSRLGRFRRSKWPSIGKQGSNIRFLAGRLLCDRASDGAKVGRVCSSRKKSSSISSP